MSRFSRNKQHHDSAEQKTHTLVLHHIPYANNADKDIIALRGDEMDDAQMPRLYGGEG